MPQLDPTWFASQLFWLAIFFTALYVALSRFVLPPLLAIMASREQTVASDIDAAQRLKTQAEDARTAYERSLAEARGQAQQLLVDAALAQKERAEEAGRDMDRQIAVKLADADRMIAAKRQQMMDALLPATEELAGMAVEKLTRRAPAKQQLVDAIGDLIKSRSQQR